MDILEQSQLANNMPATQVNFTQLIALIKQLIQEKQYEGVRLLFTNEAEAARNLSCLPIVGMELYHDVCLPNLTAKIHEEDPELYFCADELLYLIAGRAPMEELLLELLELIEETKSEFVFTSALRAIQVVLRRMGEKKPRALEWSLNSIHTRLEGLPYPDYLKKGYDAKQERLLEQDGQIEKLLMYYITVEIFYEPILQDLLTVQQEKQQQLTSDAIFYDTSINRRNVLCCFLIQLLGKPLALLNLSANEEHKTNAYTIQCAGKLTVAASRCLDDPLRLLSIGEQRVRWTRRLDAQKGVTEMSSANIFSIEEKLPLEALAVYFYMVMVEQVCLYMVPKVYAPLYIFEACLYCANELLTHEEPPLHYRALLLVQRVLDGLKGIDISADCLALEVYKTFCNALCNLIGYSSQTHLRQLGIKLLRQFILQFEDEGKYLLLKNLLRSVTHNGIAGYLAIMYKDLVAKALTNSATAPLPPFFCGPDFRSTFLQYICHLPEGVKTDLIEHADKVVSSLNALRFFAIKDSANCTGLWDFMHEIEQRFLEPLHKALDYSSSHYRCERKRLEQGLDAKAEAEERKQLAMLDINIANATAEAGGLDLEMSLERKIEILNQKLCTFDLIQSLLGRTVECVDNTKRQLKRGVAAAAGVAV